MSVYSRRKKAPAKKVPAKPAYTKTAVNNAYRDVQTKMRAEKKRLANVRKINPKSGVTGPGLEKTRKQITALGMQAREKRTKAISVAAKKYGVPKSQITARKPLNPADGLRKTTDRIRRANK
tara:strand:- start:1476 stop:1841 length:366 start_codon:yes stop_codon:yes gene_type:complete